MSSIPDDIEPIIREIDEQLKAEGFSETARSIHALREFGQRFHIPMPIAKPPNGAPDEIARNWVYAEKIHDWYNAVYGDRIKIGPDESNCVAVFAHDSLWKLRLPILLGSAEVMVSWKLGGGRNKISRGPVSINPCDNLEGITQHRLNMFAASDLSETFRQFVLGSETDRAFEGFMKKHTLFEQSRGDLTAAVIHLTARNPNFGQSRWSSLQFVEKFMKGVISIKGAKFSQTHDLRKLQKQLEQCGVRLNLDSSIDDVSCTAQVRYGEVRSTLDEAYDAHKASLFIVSSIGKAVC